MFLILAHSRAHTLPLHCLSFSLSLSLVLYLFPSFSLEGKSLSLESVLASERKARALTDRETDIEHVSDRETDSENERKI